MGWPEPIERFLDFLSPEPNTGCWLWLGALNPEGYGVFGTGMRRPKTMLAHRWGYEYFVDPIPDGMQLDHICRVRCCVNPRHLRPVTSRENSYAPGSLHNWSKTHCPKGHPYSEANTYIRQTRRERRCRKCHAELELQHYHERKQASLK